MGRASEIRYPPCLWVGERDRIRPALIDTEDTMFARGAALWAWPSGLRCVNGLGPAGEVFPGPRECGDQLHRGDPIGEFAEFVELGFGADFFGPGSLWILRVSSAFGGMLGFLIYGYESTRVCFEGVGCRVQAKIDHHQQHLLRWDRAGVGHPLGVGSALCSRFLGFGYFNTIFEPRGRVGW